MREDNIKIPYVRRFSGRGLEVSVSGYGPVCAASCQEGLCFMHLVTVLSVVRLYLYHIKHRCAAG
jgi:hypothetical protein